MNKKTEDNITQYPTSIDTRVALLEMSISHIHEAFVRIEKKLDKLDDKIDSRFFWLLSVGIAAFTGLLAVMAHGFKWF